ncbi:MAG: multicopper oxidase domain-containing protein [Acidimicrobiales bacterium]
MTFNLQRGTGRAHKGAERGGASGLSRRDFVKTGVFAGAALALPAHRLAFAASALDNRMPSSKLPLPFTLPFRRPPVAVPLRTDETSDFYRIPIVEFQADIIPGFKTMMYGYGGSFPGPTIRVERNRQVVARFANQLPARHPTLRYEPWTSVHLHGSPSLPQYDGYASDITRPGQFKDYYYPDTQSSRTMWYHDHGLHHTAQNVYQGLAGFFLEHDAAEDGLGLPSGEHDVPLMISDAMFQTSGELLFSLEDESGMWGDVMMVNGVPWPALKVKKRKYRFRLLNCCISRSLGLSLSTGDQMTVVATDGGLMPFPVKTTSLRQATAERYDVVIDFSKYAPGTRVVLRNSSPKNNDDYTHTNKVMAFDVVGDAFDPTDNAVPSELDPTCPTMLLQPSQSVATRRIKLGRGNSQWTINGNTWKTVVASGYQHVEARPVKGTVEIWEIENSSGGWFHPTHIHLVDFKVLSRNGKPPHPYEQGPKDTVYVGENEIVRVLIHFEGCGKYMIHCHNLIHEDHDMMTQYEVVDPTGYSYSPFDDPCKNLSEEDDL